MSFSHEWNEAFKNATHLSVWPWSDLVSHVMRHAQPVNPEYKVLELGCGAGANIPFFRWLKVDYSAVEGSPAIVEKLWERFPDLKEKIVVADFTRVIPFGDRFDLIVDRASLTHNSTSAIKNALALVKKVLKPEGKFIGIDWFSTHHTDYSEGRDAEDDFTRKDIQSGPFCDVGRVHFSDRTHLEYLFEDFEFLTLEHKTVHKKVPLGKIEHCFAMWNFIVKPKDHAKKKIHEG